MNSTPPTPEPSSSSAAGPIPPPPAAPCTRCASPVPPEAPGGLCPRCLLAEAATASDAGTGPRSVVKPPGLADIAAAFPELEVLGFLGAGGMGCVYRVRERASGRTLALKVLPRELASDPAFVERFEREARTLTRLHHPCIVGIHGFGHAGGFCHLLMEHVDGANLRQALRAGRFTPSQALALIPDLCDALQYAHAQGVLHRDIKPENILLDADGRVKIADFGIAKILHEPGRTAPDAFTLTHTGARVGTPHYMAPEQVERPEAVDHRADIYSLGVVFYELLTGELPLGRFQAPSAKATLDARIDDIVLRALAKERELRQQSAGEVKSELEDLASREPQPNANANANPSASGGTTHGADAAPAAPGPRRLRLRSILAGIALAWLGTWVLISILTGGLAAGFSAFDAGLRESLHALPVLLIAAVVFALFHRSTQPGSRASRWVAATSGLALVAGTLALYPRSSLPRVHRPVAARSTASTQALLALGLRLRASADRLPAHLLDIPRELRTDPATGLPFVFLAAGQTNPAPGTFLVASPRQPDGRRLVLLADGSVQSLHETVFWNLVLMNNPRVPDPLLQSLVGAPIQEATAEAALKSGTTIAHSPTEGLRRLFIDLPAAMRPIREGDFQPMTQTLHGLFTTLPDDPDREILFTLPPDLGNPGRRPDLHEKTQSRHGGLLAMLAVFAARAGDPAALEFAIERGRPLWAGREELLLCERRLDGQADQDWEEIRMRTADVLALRPLAQPGMTVIRRFKAHGPTPTTNHVDCAWPRLP